MKTQINIALAKRKLILKIEDNIFSTYPVAIGKPSTPTPTGDFKVINKIKNPGGALGSRWMQFTWRQHGIHGTNQPQSIGHAVSLGCVRMYNHDVEVVYDRVKINTPIKIRQYFDSVKGPADNPYKENTLVYTVKKGDSLWKISQQFKVPVDKIKKANQLQSNIIYPGQTLIIPEK